MSDKGIIFSAPMVRALLAGRKSQTRRLIKDAPQGDWHCDRTATGLRWVAGPGSPSMPCKLPYAIGDRLYVRECAQEVGEGYLVIYRADYPGCVPAHFENVPTLEEIKTPWRPSIHMPRKWSRLWLKVTDVRVERVQAISEADAMAEGIMHFEALGHMPHGFAAGPNDAVWTTARTAFQVLWNTLHTKPGETWADNPWIVALTFNVHHGNIDA